MLLAAFFLLFFGFSQTIFAQKEDAAVSYPAARNEKFTIQALNQISAAQATFQSTNPNWNFGTLAQLAQAGLIDEVLATGSKYGYYFTVTVQNHTPTTQPSYVAVAVPQFYRRTGNRSFYVKDYGLIRGRDRQGAPATQSDPPIEEYYVCSSVEDCETKAISNLRVLGGAQATYYSTMGNNNSYGTLCQLEQASLIDELVASGSKYGYYYIVVPTGIGTNQQYPSFKAMAIPQNYPAFGRRSFFADESGVVRAADRNGAPANADDPPIN